MRELGAVDMQDIGFGPVEDFERPSHSLPFSVASVNRREGDDPVPVVLAVSTCCLSVGERKIYPDLANVLQSVERSVKPPAERVGRPAQARAGDVRRDICDPQGPHARITSGSLA